MIHTYDSHNVILSVLNDFVDKILIHISKKII